MRLDRPPTAPAVVPLLRAYRGVPYLEAGYTDERVVVCLEAAAERGDRAGVRLGRLLLRLSPQQRKRARLSLR